MNSSHTRWLTFQQRQQWAGGREAQFPFIMLPHNDIMILAYLKIKKPTSMNETVINASEGEARNPHRIVEDYQIKLKKKV